jgi:cytochrome c biogenesis protein CcdA
MLLVALTYLAGVLTILSPCILPVLPFVFSRAQQSFLRSGVPLLAGMCVTFSALSAVALAGGEWIAQANEVGRIVAMVLLTFFGLALVFPHLAEKAMEPFTRIGSKIGVGSEGDSLGGSFLIGVSTGLLWAPCAGPILGLVLTGAATRGSLSASIFLLLSYSLGAATSLAIALVAGNKFLGTLKKFLGIDQVVKKILGIAVLLGVISIALNLDRTLLTRISKLETTSFESKLLSLIQPPQIVDKQEKLPSLEGATSWLNSKALTKEDLKGKVVLIDFWTYSCINCLRTLPYVKAWAEKYKNDDFVVIGVHTPEFAFEKNVTNVEAAVKDLGISYPIAIDSDYKIWNAFKNRFWPAHYFLDRAGKIRHHHFGEGAYEESDKIIRDLLAENGKPVKASQSAVEAKGIQAPGSQSDELSPETYLGYDRAENFASSSSFQKDIRAHYVFAKKLKADEWSIEGSWLVSKEKITSESSRGKIRFRFNGRDLHLVLGAASKIKIKVSLDGNAPGENHGIDIDSSGKGEIDSHRLYQLIRLKAESPAANHVFEIEFQESGAEAYAFTFG